MTARMDTWIGHVLISPKPKISQALQRKEAGYRGIYLLLGAKDGDPAAYIGRTDTLSERIAQHTRNGWDWDTAVLVTADENRLSPGQVQFLEARLIEKAKSISPVKIAQNSQSIPKLSEAQVASMETFLDYLYMVLPAARINVFVSNARMGNFAPDPKNPESDPTFELVINKDELRATLVYKEDEHVVLQGSIARKWSGGDNWGASYRQLQDEMRRNGILKEQGEKLVFTENCVFKSASAAAAVVTGRSANGPKEWKLKGTSKTYRKWDSEKGDA